MSVGFPSGDHERLYKFLLSISHNWFKISLEQCQPQGGARLLIVWEKINKVQVFSIKG